jgi:hypothetical protein
MPDRRLSEATSREVNAHNWLFDEDHLILSPPVEANPDNDPLVATKGILLHHYSHDRLKMRLEFYDV